MSRIRTKAIQLAVIQGLDPDRVRPYGPLVSSTIVWDPMLTAQRPAPPPLPVGTRKEARSLARRICLQDPEPIIPDGNQEI